MQAGEIRNGNTFEFEGNVFQVIEFQQVISETVLHLKWKAEYTRSSNSSM